MTFKAFSLYYLLVEDTGSGAHSCKGKGLSLMRSHPVCPPRPLCHMTDTCFPALFTQPTNNSRAAEELSLVLRVRNGVSECMQGGKRRRVEACSLFCEARVNLLWHPLREELHIRERALP